MTEQEILLDCLRRLNSAGMSYMLSGSMASNAWGIPQSTHDLVFAIQLPPAQIPTLVAAFTGDYYTDEQAVRAVYQPPYQFNAIHVPSALKVDFWLLHAAVFEQEMFRRRVRDEWFGQPLWLATAEDIILHKLYWNNLTPSDRQLADVAGVVAIQKGRLDERHLRHWAVELGVLDTLERALSGKLAPKFT
jgi:hypothetical protein